MELDLFRVPLTPENYSQFNNKMEYLGKKGSDNDFYRVQTHDDKYGYVYYIEQEQIPMLPDWFTVKLNIGGKNYSLLKKLRTMLEKDLFTKSSIDEAFKAYPTIRSFIGLGNELRNCLTMKEIGRYATQTYVCYSSAFWPQGYIKKTQNFRDLIGRLLDELESGVTIDAGSLVINDAVKDFAKSAIGQAQKVPKWVYNALATGGVVCMKVLFRDAVGNAFDGVVGDIGGDNNVGDVSDLASDFDLGGDNIGMEDLSGDDVVADADPGDSSAPLGPSDDSYNVSFQGNKTVGKDLYLDKGDKYFKCAGGATGGNNITVYVKSGTNSRYVFNGSTPICIDGKHLVTVNGRTYIVP